MPLISIFLKGDDDMSEDAHPHTQLERMRKGEYKTVLTYTDGKLTKKEVYAKDKATKLFQVVYGYTGDELTSIERTDS